MNSCIYCGETANCYDHVIPRSYLSVSRRTGKEPGFKVPSCLQCNAILGDRVFQSLVARKAFVATRLRVKLHKDSAHCGWDEDELAEMGPHMRHSVEVQQARKKIADERLRYAAGPPETRWLEMEDRWRKSHGEIGQVAS